MIYVLNLASFLISFVLAYLLGRIFRHLIPKGKENKVGLACTIGILIIFMTKDILFPSVKSLPHYGIGFGLAFGFGNSIAK